MTTKISRFLRFAQTKNLEIYDLRFSRNVNLEKIYLYDGPKTSTNEHRTLLIVSGGAGRPLYSSLERGEQSYLAMGMGTSAIY